MADLRDKEESREMIAAQNRYRALREEVRAPEELNPRVMEQMCANSDQGRLDHEEPRGKDRVDQSGAPT